MGPGRLARAAAIGATCALLLLLAATTTALAAPLRGRLDRSFGQGGRVLFGLGPTYAHSAYTAAARQPDGSVLLVGRTEAVRRSRFGSFIEPAGLVQRRLPSGALDPGFHEIVSTREFNGLALQPDGAFLYAAQAGEYSSQVQRRTADGSPDPAFGKGGESAVLPLRVRYLALGAGRIVVAGEIGVGGNCHDCIPQPVPAVARLLPNGALDKSFGKEGLFAVDQGEGEGIYPEVTGMQIEADGSIVLATEGNLYGVTSAGAANPGFGNGGRVMLEGHVGAFTQTPSGDLVTAGSTYGGYGSAGRGSFVVRAFLPSGQPDQAWGSGGATKVAVAEVDVATALAPTAAGGVVFAGEAAVANEPEGCSPCHYVPYVARLSSAGAVDPGFASTLSEPAEANREVGPTQGYSSRVGAIALTPDGQVLLAGKAEAAEQATLTALEPNGTLAPAFGSGGVASDIQLLPGSTGATAFAPGPKGLLAVSYHTNSGAYEERSALTGWARDGTPLRGYGGPAELTFAEPPVGLVADGRGRLYRAQQYTRGILRFGPNGRLDRHYGTDGVGILPRGFATKALVVRRDGTALAAGHIGGQTPWAIFELTPAGRPDRSFGHGGLVRIGWGRDRKSTVLAATFDRRGRIVLFGDYGNQTPLARLLPDGSLDPSFGNGGRRNFKPLIYTEHNLVTVGPDGHIYLTTSGRFRDTTIARFAEDGRIDRSFGERGLLRPDTGLPVLRLFADAHRLILVSGHGTYGDSGFDLRAFHLDGRPDRSFGQGGAVSHPDSKFGPVAAVRQADGRIVLGGTRNPLGIPEEVELMRFR
jgi:uncharacterized delta-60 repeat protein